MEVGSRKIGKWTNREREHRKGILKWEVRGWCEMLFEFKELQVGRRESFGSIWI